MSVFAGPYRLVKFSVGENTKFEEVSTFCIMDDCSTSERYYLNGQINFQKQMVKSHSDFTKAVIYAIGRLEYLM